MFKLLERIMNHEIMSEEREVLVNNIFQKGVVPHGKKTRVFIGFVN